MLLPGDSLPKMTDWDILLAKPMNFEPDLILCRKVKKRMFLYLSITELFTLIIRNLRFQVPGLRRVLETLPSMTPTAESSCCCVPPSQLLTPV